MIQTEIEVQGALDTLMKDRTTLIVAHRLSTIRHADRIIVITNGEIVEERPHESLIDKKGEYFKFYNMQFKDNKKNGNSDSILS